MQVTDAQVRKVMEEMGRHGQIGLAALLVLGRNGVGLHLLGRRTWAATPGLSRAGSSSPSPRPSSPHVPFPCKQGDVPRPHPETGDGGQAWRRRGRYRRCVLTEAAAGVDQPTPV